MGPCSPLRPCGPAGPTGPCAPGGPTGPCAPGGPAGPCAPGGPAGPCAPGGPAGPGGPCGPSKQPVSMNAEIARTIKDNRIYASPILETRSVVTFTFLVNPKPASTRPRWAHTRLLGPLHGGCCDSVVRNEDERASSGVAITRSWQAAAVTPVKHSVNQSVDFPDANSPIPSYLAAVGGVPLRYPKTNCRLARSSVGPRRNRRV